MGAQSFRHIEGMSRRDWPVALESPDPDDDREAYVGLREKDGKVTLRVPHGYVTDVEVPDKQQILGELMRTVARFSEVFATKVDRSNKDGRSTRDGFLTAGGGQSFSFDNQGPALGYTHLSRYVQLIRMLRDPRLMSITKAPGLTTQFDHRHISRNLERAMFLPDGTPVFDHLWAPRMQMRHSAGDMAGLACWMALDGLKHLFPDSAGHEIGAALQSEWDELAHCFEDEHELDADASLFSDKRGDTLPLLQTALENCIRLFPPVSSDARELHHLLDELLNNAISGQDGNIWGLRGFHHVWESACLEYAVEKCGTDKIFTCDDTYWLDTDSMAGKDWRNNRNRIFNKNGIARRPDLVVEQEDGSYLIIDFKYYAEREPAKFIKTRPWNPDLDLCDKDQSDFCRKAKAFQDVANVEIYRWLLMQHGLQSSDESKVVLELWVPGSTEERHECEWMKGLTLVVKPARKILGDYAKKFRLMD